MHQVVDLLFLAVLELALELTQLWHLAVRGGLLLDLKFDVVEHAIKVDWIQLDWYLHRWILLEVNHGGACLLGLDHGSCALDSLPLLWGDLLTIEHQELY